MLVGILIMSIGACTKPAPRVATVERPTLCQLTEAREAYAGRTLTVEGYLLVSDHGSVVTDPRCGRGVAIGLGNSGSPRLRALTDAIDQMRRNFEPGPWMVRIRVMGVVRQDAVETEAGRPWRLMMTAAEVLSATHLPPEDADRYYRWFEGPSPEPFQPSR